MVETKIGRKLIKYWRVLLVAVMGTALMFFVAAQIDREIKHDYGREIFTTVQGFSARSELMANLLYSYRGLFYSQMEITPDEWLTFHQSFVDGTVGQLELEVNFSEYIRDEDIIDRNEYIDLSDKEEHFILKYQHEDVDPPKVDLSISEEKYPAIIGAIESASITATQPHELLTRDGIGLTIYVHIYLPGTSFDTVEDRWANTYGVVSILIPVRKLTEQVFDIDAIEGLKVTVTDVDSGIQIFTNVSPDVPNDFRAMSQVVQVNFGDRIWDIEFWGIKFDHSKPSQRTIIVGSIFLITFFIFKAYRRSNIVQDPLLAPR
jgi:hypothetical protein